MRKVVYASFFLFLLVSPVLGSDRITHAFTGQKTPLPEAPSKAMALWLDRLHMAENCPPEGIIDSNGLRSYGPFCYQAGTFIAFIRDLNMMPLAEDAEVFNEIADPALQRELTWRILEKYPSYWSHWLNSVAKIGLPPLP